MIKNYLLITLRSLTKNKFFIFANVFGMGIAIACCIVAYFNYDFNLSFDSYHTNASTIYRVNSVREFQNNLTSYGYVPMGLGNAIKQNNVSINKVIRYSPSEGNFRIGEELFDNDLIFVDPEFFEAFTFEFIEGTAELKNKNQIIISNKLAEKYFGSDKALGKPITQLLDSGKVKEYTVSGVFIEPPSNSSFSGSAYVYFYNQFDLGEPDYNENGWRYRSTLFLQVKDASRIADIENSISTYTENNNKIREDFIIRKFELESFVGMAVRDSYNEKPGSWTNAASPIAAVLGIGIMGIFVLLIACFNLTNTAVAMSSRRLKEIGIRKVMGSTRAHLIFQFIGETAFICLLALLVGILIADFLLIPAFNKMWPDLKLVADYFGNPNFLIFISATLLFTSLLAGSYPAFYISHFQPTSILKGKLKFGGTNYFTRILLTLQFAISLIAIVSSFAFTENAKYQREFDLGFNKSGLVFTYLSNRSEYETYRNALMENPDIISIAGSEHHVNSSYINDPIKHEGNEIEVDIMNVDHDYLQTVGLTLVQGRDFKEDSETDHKESVIVTEELLRKLGMNEALGKEIVWMDTVKYYIVGVVNNIYNDGLWNEMRPVMIRYGSKDVVHHILVKVPPEKLVATNQFMEAKWKEIFPNKTYNGRFMDEELVEANTVNNNIVTMFIFLGIVALLLSATGLFTLVSLNIIKKMKEIGVRKVLGASVANISKVVNTEFIIILLIASILGGAAGVWMSTRLMSSIWKYYQEATIATLLISTSILFLTSFLSIGYKIFKTATLNPAHVLRDE